MTVRSLHYRIGKRMWSAERHGFGLGTNTQMRWICLLSTRLGRCRLRTFLLSANPLEASYFWGTRSSLISQLRARPRWVPMLPHWHTCWETVKRFLKIADYSFRKHGV